MAEDKIQMPSSGGGIVRYFDDYKGKLEIPPMYVVVAIVAVMIIEIYLYKVGL